MVYCCQFDDSRVVSGSADSSVKIWSTLSGRCLKTLQCSGEVVSSLSHVYTTNNPIKITLHKVNLSDWSFLNCPSVFTPALRFQAIVCQLVKIQRWIQCFFSQIFKNYPALLDNFKRHFTVLRDLQQGSYCGGNIWKYCSCLVLFR